MKYLARILIRYAMIKRNATVKPYLKGSVLDIGCGRAFLTNFIPPGRYVGVDGDQRILQQLKEAKSAYEFYCINVDTKEGILKLSSLSSVDTVTLLAVVEHLHHPELVFEACSLLLRNGGTLVITTPTPSGDIIGRIAFHISSGGEKAMFPHVRLYTPPDLDKLLAPLEFKMIHYRKFLIGANQLFIYSKCLEISNRHRENCDG
jgi:SAM-dependent methyltransferase